MLMRPLAALLVALTMSTPAFAAQCGGDFNTFIGSFSREAQAAGISARVIGEAFAGLVGAADGQEEPRPLALSAYGEERTRRNNPAHTVVDRPCTQ